MAVLAAALLGLLVATSTVRASTCVDRGAKDDFDIPAFMKTWYIQKIAEFPEFSGTKCDQLTFSQVENDELQMVVSFYNITSGEEGSMPVMVRKLDPKTSDARFTCQREGIFTYENTHLSILETDYNSFAVMSFCEDNTDKYTALLITRQRSPSAEAMVAAEKVLPEDLAYTTHDQTDCP